MYDQDRFIVEFFWIEFIFSRSKTARDDQHAGLQDGIIILAIYYHV